MNVSADFIERFERVQMDFKRAMYKDLCRQVDAWFAPLLAELKCGVVRESFGTTAPSTAGHQQQQQQGHLLPRPPPIVFNGFHNNLDQTASGGSVLRADPFWSAPAPATTLTNEASLVPLSEISTSEPVPEEPIDSQPEQQQQNIIKEEITSDGEEHFEVAEEEAELGNEADLGHSDCECPECEPNSDELLVKTEEPVEELPPVKRVKLEPDNSNEPGPSGQHQQHQDVVAQPQADHHPRIHHHRKHHRCRHCDQSFANKWHYLLHCQYHHPSAAFRCRWTGCGLVDNNLATILRHLQEDHQRTFGENLSRAQLSKLIEATTTATVAGQPPPPPLRNIPPPANAFADTSPQPEIIKFCRCKWPGCNYQSINSSNILRHVRSVHFRLPRTRKEQAEAGIIDDRNAGDFLEVLTRPG